MTLKSRWNLPKKERNRTSVPQWKESKVTKIKQIILKSTRKNSSVAITINHWPLILNLSSIVKIWAHLRHKAHLLIHAQMKSSKVRFGFWNRVTSIEDEEFGYLKLLMNWGSSYVRSYYVTKRVVLLFRNI